MKRLLYALYIYLVSNLSFIKVNCAVDNIFAFIIGFIYTLLKNNIEIIIMKNGIFYYPTLSFTININNYIFMNILCPNSISSLITIVISFKVRLIINFLIYIVIRFILIIRLNLL